MLENLNKKLLELIDEVDIEDENRLNRFDELLVTVYSKVPTLASIASLTLIASKGLTKTLKTILESEHCPRDDQGRVLSRNGQGNTVYLTQSLWCVHKSMHVAIPYLNVHDQQKLADNLLEEAKGGFGSLETIKRWINEDLVLSIPCTVDYDGDRVTNSIIWHYLYHILWNEKPSLKAVLQIKGMLFSKEIFHELEIYANTLTNQSEKGLFKIFHGTLTKLENKTICLRTFIHSFHELHRQGIDLRDYRYFDNQNLTQLLCNLDESQSFLHCLDELSSGASTNHIQSYLYSPPIQRDINPAHLEDIQSTHYALNTM